MQLSKVCFQLVQVNYYRTQKCLIKNDYLHQRIIVCFGHILRSCTVVFHPENKIRFVPLTVHVSTQTKSNSGILLYKPYEERQSLTLHRIWVALSSMSLFSSRFSWIFLSSKLFRWKYLLSRFTSTFNVLSKELSRPNQHPNHLCYWSVISKTDHLLRHC